MTRWLVTGSAGLLGRDLMDTLHGEQVTGLTRADLDITDDAACQAAVTATVGAGDVVVNTAAWTDVDGAEECERTAHEVNAVGVAHLATACAAAGARLIQVSTDYVFDGTATSPYDEHAPTSPANAYGRSKLAGEHVVLRGLPERGYVVRTSWLYGTAGGFPHTILRLAGGQDVVDVVDDQRGTPTWSRALAEQIRALGRQAPAPGVYHGTAGGVTTWYGFAAALFDALGLDRGRLRAVPSARFPRPAQRPSYSVLGHAGWAATGVAPLTDWRQMLEAALAAGVLRNQHLVR